MGRRIALSLALLAIAAGAFLGAVLPTSAQPTEIQATEWRAGDRDPGTRLVVELSETVAFKISGDVDPLRVFIDLPGVVSKLPGRLAALGVIANADAESHGDGTRLTVTLDKPVKIAQAFVLEPSEGKPYRLVVDFVPTSRQAFMAALVPGAVEAKPAPAPKSAPPPKPEPKAKAAAEPPPAASPPPAAAPPPVVAEPAPLTAPPPQVVPPPPPAIASPSPPAFGAPSVDEPPPPLPSQTIREPGKPPTVIVPLKPSEPSPNTPPPNTTPSPKSSSAAEGKIMVAIDPGHGGIDPGATGRDGVHEKVITLATAEAVKQALEETGRYQVLLTRGDDISVHLRERVARARLAGAQLFISIHADVLNDRTITGLSVYTLSDTATDREAEALAAKENKADVIAGVDLTASSPEVSTILIDLAQRETNTLSDVLAERLVKEIAGTAPELPKAHRSAGFAVLTAPDIPSVLIELGYLSNDKEAKRLESVDDRKRLALAIARAVDRYFQARVLQRS